MAKILIKTKDKLDDGAIVEIVVWLLEAPVPPCNHLYKYRLYYGAAGKNRIRFDNEIGKGDHVHFGIVEQPYHFSTVERLLDDFERAIKQWEDEQ